MPRLLRLPARSGRKASGRAWVVTAEKGERLPGPFDADVYVALCQLFNEAGKPGDRTVRTTYAELAKIMQRPRGGSWYEAIPASLNRLWAATIHAVQTWRVGDHIRKREKIRLIDKVTYLDRRDDHVEHTIFEVRFSEDIATSIAEGNFRLLDTSAYFVLQGPTARRLYRYLDYRRWRGTERQDAVSFALKTLADELPIDRSSPSHIKRTLDPAHAELIAAGYLAAAEYEDRPVAGKKRPEEWVGYVFAEPEPPLPDLPKLDALKALKALEAKNVGELVREILDLLGDPHSTGFYVQAVKALPEDMLRGLIGGVRESMREGASVEQGRRFFVTGVRARAKAAGIELNSPEANHGTTR
jgi:hypothetical protein